MSPELEQKLLDRWPEWFDVHGDPRRTGMTARFRCGDGWFVLIYRLCERLEPLVKELNLTLGANDSFEVLQVKEKFAGLRFYVNHLSDAIAAELDLAQLHSICTCEICGRAGQLRNERFIRTLCDECLATAPPPWLNSFAEKAIVSHFQFRLNGVVIPHILVRPVVTEGGTTHWELLANDEKIGSFVIDDNEHLPDPALPRFVLEVKDLSTPDADWEHMTTGECITLLESAGVIERF